MSHGPVVTAERDSSSHRCSRRNNRWNRRSNKRRGRYCSSKSLLSPPLPPRGSTVTRSHGHTTTAMHGTSTHPAHPCQNHQEQLRRTRAKTYMMQLPRRLDHLRAAPAQLRAPGKAEHHQVLPRRARCLPLPPDLLRFILQRAPRRDHIEPRRYTETDARKRVGVGVDRARRGAVRRAVPPKAPRPVTVKILTRSWRQLLLAIGVSDKLARRKGCNL